MIPPLFGTEEPLDWDFDNCALRGDDKSVLFRPAGFCRTLRQKSDFGDRRRFAFMEALGHIVNKSYPAVRNPIVIRRGFIASADASSTNVAVICLCFKVDLLSGERLVEPRLKHVERLF